eukprot:scaffold566544_cov18-Prasinocladus_malaysianus.AAC.1
MPPPTSIISSSLSARASLNGCAGCARTSVLTAGALPKQFITEKDTDYLSANVLPDVHHKSGHLPISGRPYKRLDFARGFDGRFVGEYMEASAPEFAVG